LTFSLFFSRTIGHKKSTATMTTSTNGTTGAAQHASIPNVASFPLQGGASVRGGGEATANLSGTTVTITDENQQQQQVEVLHLSLRARPSVRWYVNIYMGWIHNKSTDAS
jgi:hypothetical protein